MLQELTNSLEFIVFQTQMNQGILFKILLVPWIVFLLNKIFNNKLLYLGIFPRHLLGLPGIVFSPLLHANFNHLFFNSIPLAVLSNFILMQGVNYYLKVTIAITLISGILIWCFGKPGVHIGASAVITGYWSLLLMHSYQMGTITAIILGGICLYYFAGIFFGIFPGKKGVSWEGHLFGLLAGVIVSYM
jgi:membrane associated rhomboid family serine protease